jgi:hypothetical protein
MRHRSLTSYVNGLRLGALLVTCWGVFAGIVALRSQPSQAIETVFPLALLAFTMVMLSGLAIRVEREKQSQDDRIKAVENRQDREAGKLG